MKSETPSQTQIQQIRKNEHQRGLPTRLPAAVAAGRVDGLQVLHAHLAAANVGADEAGLECVGRRRALEVLLGDCGQPEAVLVSEVVAGPAASVTLDERRGAEVLQTAPGGHQ